MDTSRRARITPADQWGPLPPHASAPRRPSTSLRMLERLLLAVAVLSLGYYTYATVEAALYQAYENRELDVILTSAPASAGAPGDVAERAVRRAVPEPGSVIGRLDIPRLGVATVIRAGSDARTLKLAVGHIPGTSLPGDDGNIGLAGHRDTFFRRLRDIAADDLIHLVTPEGTFTYRVEHTHVVEPSDVWVLDATEQPSLTLVTCYPFTFLGAAPQRFIVRAQLEPAAPQSAIPQP